MIRLINIILLLSNCYCFDYGYFFNEGNLNVTDDKITGIEVVNNFKKDEILVMGMSLVLPGSGQFYKKKWKKGFAFLGIELLLWNYHNNYNDKGDYYVNQYEQFADQHWSLENWIKNYYTYINPLDPVYLAMVNETTCTQNGSYQDSNGYNGYCAPWYSAHYIEYSNLQTGSTANTRDSSSLNQFFSSVCDEGSNYYLSGCTISNSNSSYFDNITVTKDHHFYEGIGKYNLFFAGWEDTSICLNEENGNIQPSDDCRWISFNNEYQVALSSHKKYYQNQLRAKSNNRYDYAENALTLIFVNHFISMIDIFLSEFLNYEHQNVYAVPIYSVNQNNFNGMKLGFTW